MNFSMHAVTSIVLEQADAASCQLLTSLDIAQAARSSLPDPRARGQSLNQAVLQLQLPN